MDSSRFDRVFPAQFSGDLKVSWPDGKRIAVMLAFDLDAETMWTTRGDGNADHITNLSRGAYGPVQGVPRILNMLDSFGLKATFFVPGVVADKYPDVVKKSPQEAMRSASTAISTRNFPPPPANRRTPPWSGANSSSGS